MTCIDPKRSPVGSQFIHIEHLESVPVEELSDHQQRQIRQVFMVNRVELILLHESHQMGELQRDGPRLVEQKFQPTDEAIDVRHMGENIAPNDEIRLLSMT